MSEVQFKKSDVQDVFLGLEMKSAHQWTCSRLADKAKLLKKFIDEDSALNATQTATAEAIMDAVQNGHTITVVEDADFQGGANKPEPEPEPEPTAVADGANAEPEPTKPKERKPRRNASPSQNRKELKPEPEKPAVQDPAESPDGVPRGNKRGRPKKGAGVPNIRKSTRLFIAGEILKRRGHDTPLTGELIAELDDIYGAANALESSRALKNAQLAIAGYLAKPE